MRQRILITIRHGARLDAADPQWHLTSPTPYDPPLTYGGWKQSQALGARIASIIQSREAASCRTSTHGTLDSLDLGGDDVETQGPTQHYHRGRRRKQKLVIHSSPYLRCIQTSIAISAGVAQYQGSPAHHSLSSHSKPHHMHFGSPHIKAMDNRNSPRLSAILEPESPEKTGQKRTIPRTLLRVDAFLGEWLSPDYFDKITPPPGSKMMVAGAKADLLHRGDSIGLVHTSGGSTSDQGNFPGGWKSGGSSNGRSQSTSRTQSEEDTPLANLSSLSQDLPRVGRANSVVVGSPGKSAGLKTASRIERSTTRDNAGYVAPIPSYAVSPSQPIPSGYVAHARDGCVKVDYQWDSLRPPLDWGDGGEYGESWISMHKRYRKGLLEIITWYRNQDSPETFQCTSAGSPQSQDSEAEVKDDEVRDDDETDIILVLVTHGAGCNALIGALTNQPVLLDVGMASLTMAVRKSVDYKRVPFESDTTKPSSRRRHSQVDFGVSEDYEVKLAASTDHLRIGSPFMAARQLPRIPPKPVREKSPYRYERPGFAASHHHTPKAADSAFHPDAGKLTASSNNFPGSLQRSMTIASNSSGGLWSKPVSKTEDQAIERELKHSHPQVGRNATKMPGDLNGASEASEVNRLGYSDGRLINGAISSEKLANGTAHDKNQGREIARNGLWDAPPQALATERDRGSKRRWTLSQAS